MAEGREKKKLRRRETEEEVEQMDPDTFGMSPEKRAFTVERVGVNANAAGRRSHSAKHKIVSLLLLLLLLLPSLFFYSVFLALLTHPE